MIRAVNYLLVAAAAASASPAMAVTSGPYVGIEGGFAFPQNLRGSAMVDAVGINFVCLPGETHCQEVPEHFEAGDAVNTPLKRGADVDAIAGYDFGQFRVEAELGWKRIRHGGLELDPDFLAFVNAALHRPSVNPDPGAPGMPALTQRDFSSLGARVGAKTAMINLLADFEGPAELEFFGGVGLGRAWVKSNGDSDNTWAAQAVAGVRTSVRPNVTLGLKYRYFRTATLNFTGEPLDLTGNPYINFAGGLMFVQQDSATITPNLSGRVQSHSLLFSMTFDLARGPED